MRLRRTFFSPGNRTTSLSFHNLFRSLFRHSIIITMMVILVFIETSANKMACTIDIDAWTLDSGHRCQKHHCNLFVHSFFFTHARARLRSLSQLLGADCFCNTFVDGDGEPAKKRREAKRAQIVARERYKCSSAINNNADTSAVEPKPLFWVSISKSAHSIHFKYGVEMALFGYRWTRSRYGCAKIKKRNW